MSQEYFWLTPECLKYSELGTLKDVSCESETWKDGTSWTKEVVTRVIGNDVYEVTVEQTNGINGETHEETWKRNGLLHRPPGLPAHQTGKMRKFGYDELGHTQVINEEYYLYGVYYKTHTMKVNEKSYGGPDDSNTIKVDEDGPILDSPDWPNRESKITDIEINKKKPDLKIID